MTDGILCTYNQEQDPSHESNHKTITNKNLSKDKREEPNNSLTTHL